MSDPVLNQPTLRKWMPICKAVGAFENGPDMAGVLSVAFLNQLIANGKKQPRQIPVYLLPESDQPSHPEDLDERFADGWVEGLEMRGDWLYGDVKTHGKAAVAVANDWVRGASIGTVDAKTYDGNLIGQVLEHLVITNKPYVKGMNVAATAGVRGGRSVAYHFTALSTEATMADDPNKKPDDGGGVNLTEKVTALETQLVEKDGVIRDLMTQNGDLLEEVKAFRERPDLALAQKKIEQLERHNLAEKVRRITANMLRDRQINSEALRGWHDHDSDAVVLAGFRNSQFKGELNLLEYHRLSVPRNPSRSYVSGSPEVMDGELTATEKEAIVEAGKDPEVFAATRGAKSFTEYKRLKAAAQKKGA